MAVINQTKPGKAYKGKLEIEARNFMQSHNVFQVDIASYEGVGDSAINNRLTRLNPPKLKAFKELVLKVKTHKESQFMKATG
ncbi:MAG: hypothetical protein RLN90_09705 [Balneolaceae bacterium]